MNRFLLSRSRAAIGLLAVLGVCCVGGCAGKPTAKVHGKVTLDGKPIAVGSITFLPVDRKGRSADAAIEEGQYTAEVPVGSMRVEIHSPKLVGTRTMFKKDPNSKTKEFWQETIPARFNSRSKLTQDITPGDHEVNFELKSKGEKAQTD